MDDLTTDLLDRWHRGDQEALLELVRRHAPWLHAYVSKRMTPTARRFETSEDVVQTVLMNLLRYTPPFRPETEIQFRALVARAVLNRLHDLHEYATSPVRDVDKTERVPSAISRIGVAHGSSARPDARIERDEQRGFIALALQLIDPEERRIIHMHEWEELKFSAIGERLAISEVAARFRFNRAVKALGEQVKRLKTGDLGDLLNALEAEPHANGSG